MSACTSLGERGEIKISIAADESVRSHVVDVVATLEVEAPGGGWSEHTVRRLEVGAGTDWPLKLVVVGDRSELSGTYQLSANARDMQGAIVAHARVIRSYPEDARSLALSLHFEAACMFVPPCATGTTCHDAECVDANSEYTPSIAVGQNTESAASEPTNGSPASPDLPCAVAGERSCAGSASRFRLLCDGAVWRAQPPCAEEERCATEPGNDQGMCLPIAPACRDREPDERICLEEQMLACRDLVTLDPRPCGTNEHCVTTDAGARCECKVGFHSDGTVCVQANECDVDRSRCDRLTMCEMKAGRPVCGACPSGFLGDGDVGCTPQLLDLRPDVGTLSPSLSSDQHAYRVQVPLLTAQLSFQLASPLESRIEVDGTPLNGEGRWTSRTLAMGANTSRVTVIAASGATSTYELTIERTGGQTAFAKAHAPSSSDLFGISIGLSDDTLVVGAFREDGSATTINGDVDEGSTDSGAAYVYVRRDEGWQQQAYLKAADAARGAYFGTSIAISGDTIAVGATHDDTFNPTASSTGAGVVYVFARNQDTWRQQARLVSSSSTTGDQFGYHVALEGNRLLVGASGDGGPGAAYVFERTGDSWSETQKLVPSASAGSAAFGCYVALSGDSIAIGAQNDSNGARNGGSAYVFVKQGATWIEQVRLAPEPAIESAAFGFGLALHGDRLVVGAPRLTSIFSPISSMPPGEAYVFARNAGQWSQVELLTATEPRPSDNFGSSVSMNASTLAIGALGDTSSGAGVGAERSDSDLSFSGAAYLYSHDGERWRETAFIKAARPHADDMFGFQTALSGRDLAVSACFDSSAAQGVNASSTSQLSSSGATYVFH